MQDTSKELSVLKGQVSKYENQANSIEIKTPEDYTNTVDFLSKLKETGSKIKKLKESITKPLNEALKNTRNIFNPIEEQFGNAEATTKEKLLVYAKKVNEEAEKREAKIAEKVEAGKMKLETGEKKMGEIEKVEKNTQGKIGEVQIKKIKKVRIVNETLIPRLYLVPDEVAIRRDALSGIEIPGVETYFEDSISAK